MGVTAELYLVIFIVCGNFWC